MIEAGDLVSFDTDLIGPYGYDGDIEDGVVMCLEMYVGEPGGHEGVKLENEVYVTGGGAEQLDTFPMDLVPD